MIAGSSLREFVKDSRISAAFAPGANRAPQFSSLVSQLFRTLLAFDIETIDLAKHSQSGGQFFGIHASNDGKIMIFAGGILLKHEGKVVGAIGVSGGSGDQDRDWFRLRSEVQEFQAVPKTVTKVRGNGDAGSRFHG